MRTFPTFVVLSARAGSGPAAVSSPGLEETTEAAWLPSTFPRSACSERGRASVRDYCRTTGDHRVAFDPIATDLTRMELQPSSCVTPLSVPPLS